MNTPEDSHNLIKERKDALLGMYCESCTHARHYEDQRATVANMILLATVGLIGYIGHLDHEDWPLTLAIMLLGIFGSVFTAIYFDRISRFERRADGFQKALDELLFERHEFEGNVATLSQIEDAADGQRAEKFQSPGKLRAAKLFRMFWPLFIAIIALGFTIYARHKPPHTPSNSQLTINCTGPIDVGHSEQK